ncbi:FeoB-associated Cys-rich membrane protein [Desulfurispira natronophila]|uniref:FeoB-associated Cys-rich membrane protein n=1 Tax=Desulfurispira natronophila TaxID=682562 RepID=A0A7W7Y5M4_9BACT|nr:hypothetical protein [Desulfurispira natronophila]
MEMTVIAIIAAALGTYALIRRWQKRRREKTTGATGSCGGQCQNCGNHSSLQTTVRSETPRNR